MKKTSWLIALIVLFISAGCFDTVDETTINDNGTGTFVHKDDLGKMFSMIKMFAGDNEKMKDLGQLKKDTTITLKNFKDSIDNLSGAEKKILESGVLKVNVDADKEMFNFVFSFPFSKPAEINEISQVLKKAKKQILDDAMKNSLAQSKSDENIKMFDKDLGDADLKGSDAGINDYYTIEYQKGKLSSKVNKGKLANLDNDKGMSSLKQMNAMGMNSNMKIVFNLPKPAKKTNGKGITVSDDKKTIIIEGTLEDFFEDPSKFEYEIEY